MGPPLDIEGIKNAVTNIAMSFDIEKIYLFGSYARGDSRIGSDVDLCFETGDSFTLFNAGDFSQMLSQVLGCSVDVVTERSMYPYARESMLGDRVLIYERP